MYQKVTNPVQSRHHITFYFVTEICLIDLIKEELYASFSHIFDNQAYIKTNWPATNTNNFDGPLVNPCLILALDNTLQSSFIFYKRSEQREYFFVTKYEYKYIQNVLFNTNMNTNTNTNTNTNMNTCILECDTPSSACSGN